MFCCASGRLAGICCNYVKFAFALATSLKTQWRRKIISKSFSRSFHCLQKGFISSFSPPQRFIIKNLCTTSTWCNFSHLSDVNSAGNHPPLMNWARSNSFCHGNCLLYIRIIRGNAKKHLNITWDFQTSTDTTYISLSSNFIQLSFVFPKCHVIKPCFECERKRDKQQFQIGKHVNDVQCYEAHK